MAIKEVREVRVRRNPSTWLSDWSSAINWLVYDPETSRRNPSQQPYAYARVPGYTGYWISGRGLIISSSTNIKASYYARGCANGT